MDWSGLKWIVFQCRGLNSQYCLNKKSDKNKVRNDNINYFRTTDHSSNYVLLKNDS